MEKYYHKDEVEEFVWNNVEPMVAEKAASDFLKNKGVEVKVTLEGEISDHDCQDYLLAHYPQDYIKCMVDAAKNDWGMEEMLGAEVGTWTTIGSQEYLVLDTSLGEVLCKECLDITRQGDINTISVYDEDLEYLGFIQGEFGDYAYYSEIVDAIDTELI